MFLTKEEAKGEITKPVEKFQQIPDSEVKHYDEEKTRGLLLGYLKENNGQRKR